MTDLLDRTITALRTNHDEVAALATELSEEQLLGPSGAEEWTVAQVLSHLGSGAEIMGGQLAAAVTGEPRDVENTAVWARWDAASPAEQAAWFVEHDGRLVRALEGLGAEQRGSLRVDLGFLPEPAPLSTFAGMRLNEAAQHAWDVRVAGDAAAELEPSSAEALAEHFSGDLGFMLGFTAKPEHSPGPARVAAGDRTLVIDDGQVSLTAPVEDATATFHGSTEALLRLLAGRLKPGSTPAGTTVSGNVSLDDLRRVFPGY
ncbi:TIGR03083 family protein [Nocardioides alpinus]|uniref:Maleylpyruvate isomerase family mycothiol-dependent enzyme n=1 Tax=Nocardioides alpinus TaxID=748909 RepID=A0A1I0W772_9ACTN|nr:maleylpyruvate isomerase family mycothiol-dependent enzyme [Nocardioides alpinus]PKH37734.1 maleylpyruvate isomerase family mycothiol-dependent enzyme [Nocardioides alpinus]SFA84394.1 TIGR03083 family protein [Nocardioides alpinus]